MNIELTVSCCGPTLEAQVAESGLVSRSFLVRCLLAKRYRRARARKRS